MCSYVVVSGTLYSQNDFGLNFGPYNNFFSLSLKIFLAFTKIELTLILSTATTKMTLLNY